MHTQQESHRTRLERIAYQAMLARGLLPDFSPAVMAEIHDMREPVVTLDESIRDRREMLWSSIDNDDSLDLDQLTAADEVGEKGTKILVAIADVDELVRKTSAVDQHARQNTCSVYTAAQIFPMLPEKLSNGLTSLNQDVDRLAIVVEMVVGPEGTITGSGIQRALVRNRAKLAYKSVAAWLEGSGKVPAAVASVPRLAENLRLQDNAAQRMKRHRHLHGALSLETIQARPIFELDQILGLQVDEKNRARELIEDFMIAANGVVARYLDGKNYPSLRRVVRTPRRWDRIVELAGEHGYNLPGKPDSRALEEFLSWQKTADPLRYPDLSISVIKLLGAGEYVADFPGSTPPGHFGLAVKDYTHSTAPNRRFSDLVSQRLLKASFTGQKVPYSRNELSELAQHCTEAEDAVTKLERQVGKSAAALLLESRIGEHFQSIVTGASVKGTWVRLLDIPVEGKLVEGYRQLDVGHRVEVQLISVDVERGFIDFRRAGTKK